MKITELPNQNSPEQKPGIPALPGGCREGGMTNLLQTTHAQEKKIYVLAVAFLLLERLRHFGLLGAFAAHGASKLLFDASGALLGLYIGIKVVAWRKRATLQHDATEPNSI